MSDNHDEIPPLRMAPRRTLDELVQRVEREKRVHRRHRESKLENSPVRHRIGSVPFLNAVPLTRGIEHLTTFVPPSQLAEMLRKGELDAALVSVTEVLLNEGYEVLDGIGVCSLGEVFSVIVAHKQPLDKMEVVHCDPASLTSVNLLKVLLAEQGRQIEFRPLESYRDAPAHDNVLLIGNSAIDFRREEPEHAIWDLGAAWYELTRLPFVYAVWAIREDVDNKRELLDELRDAKDFGMDTLDFIISDREDYDRDFRQDYLGWHIHYHIATDEKRALEKFAGLLSQHGLGSVHDLRFVA